VKRLTGGPVRGVVSTSAVALRRHVVRLSLLGLAFSGCGPAATLLETKVLPEPEPPAGAQGQGLPQAYPRSHINDPGLRTCAEDFKTWALQQRSPGADPAPLFLRVEVQPPTRTILPYGVGAYQQEQRLPAILTVGPGWASLKSDAREAAAAQAFRQLAGGLEALKLDPPLRLRPTLTIQTESGLVLGWINDLLEGRKNLHGEGD
jgi:hypothetical protein